MAPRRAIDALSAAGQARERVTLARQAWQAHEKHCSACHLAKGHAAHYCDHGFRLAQEVTRAAAAAAEAVDELAAQALELF